MEHRHTPNGRGGQSSSTTRTQRDLSSSPHQDNHIETNGHPTMIRRAAGRVPHVCIVGAGVAGLRCADLLLHQGINVTIVEGRDRIGGRLCQSDALGHKVDLGPNWIHGTENNPILDLCKETNTTTMSWDGRQAVFDQHGKEMPPDDAVENSEVVWSIIEKAMKYSNDQSADIPAEKSLYDFFKEQLDNMLSSAQSSDQLHVRRETILQMAEMWGAFVGSPIQTQSLKFFWLEECIDGENLFVAETYHKVLARIARPALDRAEMVFDTKVSSIESTGIEDEPRVSIKTENGKQLTFDEVVVTAPLGWLQRNEKAFQPELPERLKQAIDSSHYGHLDKVYITFPTAFWNDTSSLSQSVPPTSPSTHPSIEPNVTATTAPLNQSAPPTVNPNHWPGFTHWISPRYTTDTNPAHWNQECVNFAALPDNTAFPTLLFYIYGPTSIHIASTLASQPTSTHKDLLTRFFVPYFSRLPNYSSSDPSHQPKAVLASTWANDELAGYGSYTNFQTGLENGDRDIEIMRYGVPERGLWLAGEHTAPFVALGTVTGAYWAGEGVAKRIIKAYGLGAKDGDETSSNENGL